MSRRNTKSHVAVERHLEERAQYEAWLVKLESGASGIPAQVLERVRADYRSRLERVTRELARYEKDLETTLAESEVRRDELVAQRTARSEALAETELRHHVGEYDDAKFHEQSAELQVALAQLAEEIAATERDIAKFEEILGLIAGVLPETSVPATAPPPPVVTAVPPKAPEPEPSPAPSPEAATEPSIRAIGMDSAEPGLDELAFLRSVVPGGDDASGEPGGPQPAPPAPATPATPTAPLPTTGTGKKPAPTDAPAVRPKPEASRRASPKETRLARGSAESDQGAKTLRCTECGTLNLPTEWYCEKCGAELSAF